MTKSITVLLILLLSVTCKTADRTAHQRRASQRVFHLINEFRKEHGLPELRYLHRRQWEVDIWARHLEKRFEHCETGYACENIAVNFDSPEQLFEQWKNSPGHRKNMLLRRIRYCAIGVREGTYRRTPGAYFGVFRGYETKLKALK